MNVSSHEAPENIWTSNLTRCFLRFRVNEFALPPAHVSGPSGVRTAVSGVWGDSHCQRQGLKAGHGPHQDSMGTADTSIVHQVHQDWETEFGPVLGRGQLQGRFHQQLLRLQCPLCFASIEGQVVASCGKDNMTCFDMVDETFHTGYHGTCLHLCLCTPSSMSTSSQSSASLRDEEFFGGEFHLNIFVVYLFMVPVAAFSLRRFAAWVTSFPEVRVHGYPEVPKDPWPFNGRGEMAMAMVALLHVHAVHQVLSLFLTVHELFYF